MVLHLDAVLLGLVDRLGTVRGNLHRPSLSGTNDSTVHHRRHAGPHPGGYDLVRCDGWLGNLPTTLWRRRLVTEGEVSAEGSLFTVLGDLPLGTLFSIVGIILVVLFFITSSDSGSLVMNMLTAGGHPNPPTWSRVLFSTLEGAIAIGLLLAGGLEGLQAASLATALPFSIIMVFMALAVYRGLRLDSARADQALLERRMNLFTEHVSDRYHLEDIDPARPERDQIDYRISQTTGPRIKAARRRQNMRDLRQIDEERATRQTQARRDRQDRDTDSDE